MTDKPPDSVRFVADMELVDIEHPSRSHLLVWSEQPNGELHYMRPRDFSTLLNNRESAWSGPVCASGTWETRTVRGMKIVVYISP